MTLTTHLLTLNNEQTLDKCLTSLKPLRARTLVLDCGSTDKTAQIAADHGAKVVSVGKVADRSSVLNQQLIQCESDWHLELGPWETIGNGLQAFSDALVGPPAAYRVFLSQGDLITKPVRLYHGSLGLRYSGPVFESLVPEPDAHALNAVLFAEPQDHTDEQLRVVRSWEKSSPASHEPFYYEAMIHLSKFRYDEFLPAAENFLFRATRMSMSVVMTRYYLAWVHCVIKRSAHDSLKNLMVCLSLKPLMAEFWCLLGDIYYHLAPDYKKAMRFYETALSLGGKRRMSDDWPVHLSRYGEYPRKMLQSCTEILAKRRVIVA
jgi:glycosyltransferase involved in cell wall biosynthesis